jgi:AcrR family transcriptional regulator
MSLPTELQPRKSPAQGRSVRMVDDILEATARVLVTDGWEKASTNRIARAAGVSVGSLYQYFPNKEALILALSERHASEMMALFSETAARLAGAPLEAAVPAIVRGMLDAHRIEPRLHVALVHQLLASGLAGLDTIHRSAHALVRGYLEQHRGALVVDDLDTAAWLCVTTVESVVHAAVLDPREGRLADPAVERELVAMLLRYLVGRPA